MGQHTAKFFNFGKHRLTSPTFFASYRLGDYPAAGLKFFPWNITGTEALLINAYDLRRRKYQHAINNGWQPARDLEFPDKPLLIDSGAYYFIRKANIDVSANEILDLQIKSRADIGVVLDHPFGPKDTDKSKRQRRTLSNTKSMLCGLRERKAKLKPMPVLHGKTPADAVKFLKRVRSLFDAEGWPFERVGIGSLAPLAQSGQVSHAIEIIRRVRAEIPRVHLHCFSMGSALSMILAFQSGANSVDSQSWILSAGFKYAQLPGHYLMRMARRDYPTKEEFCNAMKKFEERLNRLAGEEGFTVKNWLTGETLDLSSFSVREQYVQMLIDTASNENVHNRACHNLHVYNFEVRQFRQAVHESRLHAHVLSRLNGTRYAKSIEAFRSSL